MSKPMTEREYYNSTAHLKSEKSYDQYLKDRRKRKTTRNSNVQFGIRIPTFRF